MDRKSKQQNTDTVQKPLLALILSKGLKGVKRADQMTAWDMGKLADEGDGPGHLAAAYIAASRFKHRMLGINR